MGLVCGSRGKRSLDCGSVDRPRPVGRSPSHVEHQLPGDAGSISSFETLSPRPASASAHRQYVGGLLHIKKQIYC